MLEFDGVGFRYPGRPWVLEDVTLSVPAGSLTAVLGRNGAGKTTLVRCAAGLLRPQRGSVRTAGVVGFVPQARTGAFAYRALDMVVMGRARQVAVFGTPSRSDRLAALDAMERVGIADLHDRQFPTLSGGEQQLVLVARAIAGEAPILALDEPAAGLDLHHQVQVLALLAKLVADGMSILLSTHHPDHASHLADSVALVRGDGRVTVGPPEALLADDVLTEVYGVDVTTVRHVQDGNEYRSIVTRYDGSGTHSATR